MTWIDPITKEMFKGYTPETWRYRIGDYRFFYEIDGKKKTVFMIAAGLRAKGY